MDGAFPSVIQITSKEKPQKGGAETTEGAHEAPRPRMWACVLMVLPERLIDRIAL